MSDVVHHNLILPSMTVTDTNPKPIGIASCLREAEHPKKTVFTKIQFS